MAIRFVDLSIRGWFPDGRLVADHDFLELLRLNDADLVRTEPSDAPAQAARLVFLTLPVANRTLNPNEIAEVMENHLALLTQWLRDREPDLFVRLRGSGLVIDVCVDVGVDGRELDVKLPADLLLECGRRGLAIQWNVHDFMIDRE